MKSRLNTLNQTINLFRVTVLSIVLMPFSTIEIKAQNKIFEEKSGILSVEAENYTSQELTEIREWKTIKSEDPQPVEQDPDPNHAGTASNGAYLEILPDTRTNHSEKLIHGVNFSNEPGKIGILNYKVYFNNPGKYFVWVRIYSTGPEDNGIHVGLDGEWPESGQCMQWCEGKNQWAWESKQRTVENHCGEAEMIFLEVDSPGLHTISFSMREDGFEFDKGC